MNKVVHFEIPSDDQARAKKFYAEVFDWQVQDSPYEGGVYSFAITTPVDDDYMYTEPGGSNGGIVEREEATRSPVVTIEVPSIDQHIPRIEAAGGTMLGPKGEVPGMGFYAYFKDSEGNVMGLWENLAT